ncbi:phage recombination protein Bet [Methanosalsum natronophilum]|uniref:phage recombination protein Bet n=1 Tax=Methanosalsum natronophilum TaxID=768733 RepID=UPI002167886A|nr:phage recombination protein Bet [Methanosalsum natronophilum]MCS3924426.1 phage recombination protein Bet [Methanosalsum natronophilum]
MNTENMTTEQRLEVAELVEQGFEKEDAIAQVLRKDDNEHYTPAIQDLAAQSEKSGDEGYARNDVQTQIITDKECRVYQLQPKPIKYSEEQVSTITNTVARGADDNELAMFLHICRTYGLDPFLKEIFYSSELKCIMTSRDGYLKIAQRDPEFRGIKSAVVHENDQFTMNVAENQVQHSFGVKDRGEIVGAWAVVEREGRIPVLQFAPFNEYKKNSSTWKTYPSAMISKCAEALALKRQFGISGLMTQEEVV